MRLSGIKKELKKYKNALVPADTGEIILQIDGKPELPPAEPRRNRIVLDMRMGWDNPLEGERKRKANQHDPPGISSKKSEKDFIKAEVSARPIAHRGNMGIDNPENAPQVEGASKKNPQPEEERGREPGEIARLMGRRRR
jgi:hypothetical protein